MVEYTSLKVPELKKLLQERGLAATGNKADLVARLQEDDKQNQGPEAEEKPGTSLPQRTFQQGASVCDRPCASLSV
jgi:hypothetical protein